MILDQYGQPIPEASFQSPRPGRQILRSWGDRAEEDVSRSLTPARLDEIFSAADAGDASDQAALAEKILEKNHEIGDAFDVRCKAVQGLTWSVLPGDESSRAKEAAKAMEKALRDAGSTPECDTFDDLIADMMCSLIVGYSLNEILWGPGGTLLGFSSIPARKIDFMNSFTPRITLDNAPPKDPEPGKYVWAHCRMRGSDPVKGGLIRPLGWLHCFMTMEIKDLLSYAERYGMPMIVAKVAGDSFEQERRELERMIRNFGANGGGLVTQGTEIEPVQAGNTTGDIYFKLLEYFGKAIHRRILGQTASSSDGGGLSKDNAQSEVRQDILEADAKYLASTVNSRLIAPWMRYNFGDGVPLPKLDFDVAPPEDKKELSDMLKTMKEAGFTVDPIEINDRLGLKLKRVEEAMPTPDPNATPAAGVDPAESAKTLNLKQKYDAMGVAIRAGLLTATPEIEEQTRAELGLPAMTQEVQKAWAATGGIRQPITLKATEAAAVDDALAVDDKAAKAKPIQNAPSGTVQMGETPLRGEAIMSAIRSGLIHQTGDVNRILSGCLKVPLNCIQLAEPEKKKSDEVVTDAVDAWFGPVEKALSDLIDTADPAAFSAKLAQLAENPPFGSSEKFEGQLEETIYTGIAAGAVAEHDRLKARTKGK